MCLRIPPLFFIIEPYCLAYELGALEKRIQYAPSLPILQPVYMIITVVAGGDACPSVAVVFKCAGGGGGVGDDDEFAVGLARLFAGRVEVENAVIVIHEFGFVLVGGEDERVIFPRPEEKIFRHEHAHLALTGDVINPVAHLLCAGDELLGVFRAPERYPRDVAVAHQ